jgi:PAS domain S-box-containing protein
MASAKTNGNAAAELTAVKARLSELEATLDAIRSGAVDALVVSGPDGEQIFTLKGADQAYRVLVEAMNEGAVTIGSDGTVLYANTRFAGMLKTPLEKVLGIPLASFVALRERQSLRDFLETSAEGNATMETTLLAGDGAEISVHLSGNPLPDVGVSGICVVVTDITQRKLVEKAQRDLSQNILEVQEKERQRVARELHDGVNQLLSSTKHRLHDMETRLIGQTTLRRNTVQVRKLVERTIAEIRSISRNLRPSELDDLGLVAAVRTLGAEFAKRNRVRVDFALAELTHPLTPQIELTIYRIVQEALANVAKHARATRVHLDLTSSRSHVFLQVRDNGRGFVEQKRNGSHWGLINMRERASHVNGTFELVSQPGKGTTIKLKVPL